MFEKEVSSIEMKQHGFRSVAIRVDYKILYRKIVIGSSFLMFQGLSRRDIVIKFNISYTRGILRYLPTIHFNLKGADMLFQDFIQWIFSLYTILLRTQNTAYPTPSPEGNMIHGRHNGVSLNFQAKIPTARIPDIMPMILGSVIYPSFPSIPSHT